MVADKATRGLFRCAWSGARRAPAPHQPALDPGQPRAVGHLKIDYVFLINDLQANGYGIAELGAEQIYTLSEGDPRQMGNRALISAGTGLGEGFMIWDGRYYMPYPSEGGHATLRRATRTRSICCASCGRNTTGASALSAW